MPQEDRKSTAANGGITHRDGLTTLRRTGFAGPGRPTNADARGPLAGGRGPSRHRRTSGKKISPRGSTNVIRGRFSTRRNVSPAKGSSGASLKAKWRSGLAETASDVGGEWPPHCGRRRQQGAFDLRQRGAHACTLAHREGWN